MRAGLTLSSGLYHTSASAETGIGGNEASPSPRSQLFGDKNCASVTSWFVFLLLIYFKLEWASLRFLGQEDPLEKRMATRSSILAQRIPWTEVPGGLQSVGSQKSLT